MNTSPDQQNDRHLPCIQLYTNLYTYSRDERSMGTLTDLCAALLYESVVLTVPPLRPMGASSVGGAVFPYPYPLRSPSRCV